MKEEYQTRSQESNLTKYLAEHESMNNGRSFFGCVFHFLTPHIIQLQRTKS